MAGAVVAATALTSNTNVEAELSSRLMTVAELPVGWHATPVSTATESLAANRCLAGFPTGASHDAHATATFGEGSGLPFLSDSLARVASPSRLLDTIAARLSRCASINIREGGVTLHGIVTRISLAHVAGHSAAFSMVFTLPEVTISADAVFFTTAQDLGEVVYGDSVTPAPRSVVAYARAAVQRAGGADPVVAPQSVVSAPVRLARTTDGVVAYREFGHGPALVMVMGYSAPMEDWDPRFVDALAEHFTVVIFDNAGIGATGSLPAPLTIDAMAQQTSALIDDLGLGRVDLLGWSMGSMIAEALASLHPSQVNRLVLCADSPGTGAAVPPTQKNINALTDGDAQGAIADLFPADQASADATFADALSDYPSPPVTSPTIIKDQGNAVLRWWRGEDPAGKDTAAVIAPTLLADGVADRLDPVINDRLLHDLLAGSRLVLYPDAGHAFFIQDEATFVPLVESFLG